MKTYRINIYLLLIITSFFMFSCEEYLDKTEKADISEADVFSSFVNFQGFVEPLYCDIIDPMMSPYNEHSWNYSDDCVTNAYRGFQEGDYWWIMASGKHSAYFNPDYKRNCDRISAGFVGSVWHNSWAAIRDANTAISHLDDMVLATDEEKQFIEGQAYFFRGYFHWAIMKAWGSIPYIETAFVPTSDMKIPVLSFHETAEKIIKDLEKAAQLLPVNWDETTVGKATLGQNIGRATKGQALAVMAECLMFCGSPLMNGVSTGDYNYNTEYCKRAADISWDIIEMANQGVYQLQPWTDYKIMFSRMDAIVPVTKESLFRPIHRGESRWYYGTYGFAGDRYDGASQNYVELFEMSNGLPIEDPASGYDPMNPWINRDPRFLFNIVLDGDRIVKKNDLPTSFAQFYVGGVNKDGRGSLTGFGQKKYWQLTANLTDNGFSGRNMNNVLYYIRLAEIYLFYAEAVNEAYGPTGNAPGSSLTAIDAVNIIRTRAGQPNVNAKFLVSKEAFRERIRNERAIELAWEAKRWCDLRRWYVAHLPKHKEIYGLNFDKAHTYFSKYLVRTIVFDMKHYWLPFPTKDISLYEGWKQNPGW